MFYTFSDNEIADNENKYDGGWHGRFPETDLLNLFQVLEILT